MGPNFGPENTKNNPCMVNVDFAQWTSPTLHGTKDLFITLINSLSKWV